MKSNAVLLQEGIWVTCCRCGCSTLELQEKATEAWGGGFPEFICPECGTPNKMFEVK